MSISASASSSSLSYSPPSIQTSLIDIINNNFTITTLCCKQIRATIINKYLYKKWTQDNVLPLNMNAISDDRNMLLNVTSIGRNASGHMIYATELFFPTTILINNQTDFNVPLQFSWAGVATVIGNYNVSIILTDVYTGLAVDDYEVYYTTGNDYEIIGNEIEPITPQLVSAVYSTDGLYVTVTFGSLTNKMGIGSSLIFTCSDLLSFLGSNVTSTTCIWESAAVFHIYPSSAASTLDIGDNITVKGDTLKAWCSPKDSTS